MDPIDVRRQRGLLAEHRMTHRRFAQACGLGRPYTSQILAGSVEPGEVARFKLVVGLQRLGLDLEVRHAG
jgi:hypothetical protein